MARPLKEGLQYFPFDVDFFSDPKIRALKGRFGNDGIMLYIYLLTQIYGSHGYYMVWDEDVIDCVIADLNLSENFILQVIEYLVNRSLLSKSILINSVTVLSSHGIQKRYQEAAKSLKRDVFVKENVWLLNETETAAFIKFAQKQEKSQGNNSKSEKNNNKSKKNNTNEIKRNIDENKDNNKENKKQPKHRYGKYSHVTLTNEEGAKLVAEFGQKNTDNAIKYLDEYVERKGYKHSSSYLTIRKWVFDALKKEGIYDEGYNAGNKGEQAGRKIYGTVL